MLSTRINSLKLLQWNAQGVTTQSTITQLEHLIVSHNIDVIFLQETFLNTKHKFSLKNYQTYRNDRTNQHGGGVAIAIKSTVKHQLIPHYNTTTIENISIEIKINGTPTVLTSAYSPRYAPNFITDINKMTPTNKKYILFGDLNARHTSWGCTTNNKAGKALFIHQNASNFVIHNTESPTHFPHSGATPSNIDFLVTNATFHFNTPYTLNGSLPSDHCPVVCTIGTDTVDTNNTASFNFSQADWTKYKEHFSRCNIQVSELNTTGDIDRALTNFIDCLNEAKRQAIPLHNTHKNRNIVSYTTSLLIRQRNVIQRQWQRCPQNQHRLALKTQLNSLNKQIKHTIHTERNESWNRTLRNVPKGSKQLWKITSKLKGTTPKSSHFIVAGKQITTDAEKAELLANEFSKNHTLTINYAHGNDNKVRESNHRLDRQQMDPNSFNNITYEELCTIVKRLKNNKSPGIDGISNKLIKKLPNTAIQQLVNIFNACFQQSYFPTSFKEAKVIPIPKSGKNHTLPSNYRPISLLSSIGKLLEKIIQIRINAFTMENELHLPEQFGFRSGHSTTHQLKRITKHIVTNKLQKKSTGLVLLDIERAFDSIWHDGLIHKLMKMNFPVHLIKMIKCFVNDRSFRVHMTNNLSSKQCIPAGLVQGSPLSPILYALYISDMKKPRLCDLAFFADDTGLFTSAKQSNAVMRKLQKGLTQIQQYFTKWRIKLNNEKTQAILFKFNCSSKRNTTVKLSLENAEIIPSKEVKYLGLTLDDKLLYSKHIDNTITKANKCFRALYPLLANKSQLNINNKLLLYKCAIQPILMYAGAVWVSAANCHINKIQIFQNKCLKCILNQPRWFPTSRLHEQTQTKMVKQFIIESNSEFTDKCAMSEFEIIRNLV